MEVVGEAEVEVLRLIANGLSNQEIAPALTIAVATFETHLSNIYGKPTGGAAPRPSPAPVRGA